MFRDGRCSRGHDITLPGAVLTTGTARRRDNCRRCLAIRQMDTAIRGHYLSLGLDSTDTTAAVLTDAQYLLRRMAR